MSGDASLDAFLRAIAQNTRSVDELKASVDRLTEEFVKLRAQAPAPQPDTPADRIAEVAGDALSQALSQALGGGKKKRR